MKEKQVGRWRQVECPLCGKSFQSRGLPAHVRWVHGLAALPPGLPAAPQEPAAKNPAGKPLEAAAPKVFKVPKARALPSKDTELAVEAAGEKKADEKSPPALKPGARPPGGKGLLDWDNFFDREFADGLKIIDDGVPPGEKKKKKKGSESPWVAFGWALGSVALMVYFGHRKERETAAAAATAAAPAAPSSTAATVGSVDSGMGGPWDEEGD